MEESFAVEKVSKLEAAKRQLRTVTVRLRADVTQFNVLSSS